MQPTMICTQCGETKPLESFRADRSRSNGRKRLCKRCNTANTVAWEKRNKEQVRRAKKLAGQQYRPHLRAQVLAAYGNKCACCGESEPKFLSVDHIYNDGSKHRRELGIPAGWRFYAWLARNNFPTDRFQLLCFNCNFAKGLYGECPHKTQK